jgi:FimV-like protein
MGHVGAVTLGEPQVSKQERSDGLWLVELPLVDLGKVTPGQIQARLAPPPAWAAAGLSLVDAQDIQLSIQSTAQGGVLSLLIRAKPGFFDALVELQWPTGRMLREVGLLLGPADTPGFVPHVGAPGKVWVQSGDTASQLLFNHIQSSDNLSQALLALQQANPDAFDGGNVNRLRQGAVLRLPTPAEIRAIDPVLAQEIMAQQIEEFAVYRTELAAGSGPAGEESAQVASGKVQPAQREKATANGDRLTLSAPGGDKGDDSDQLAQRRQAQQTAERAAELNRNIQELNRLAQGDDGAGLTSPLPKPAQLPPSALIDQLSSNPATPWVAGGLMVVLLAWALISIRRSGTALEADSAAMPAQLKVDFDLNLPGEQDLPPLPSALDAPPTPATPSARAASAQGLAPQAAGMPLAGLSLDLDDLSGFPSWMSKSVPQDPMQLKWSLAQALWLAGKPRTALVLAREVAADGSGELAQSARRWLDERG